MKKEKEELLVHITTILFNPESKNVNMGFVGKPGTGKTQLVRTLAKVLELPFVHISMGGCKDPALLVGSSPVYESSEPGAIVKGLCRTGYKNCILYLDEIDKIDDSHQATPVINSLIHILDPLQRDKHHDLFMGHDLPIDLRYAWIFYTLNDPSRLRGPLLDRMKIFHVTPQDVAGKCQVVKLHTIPNVLANIGNPRLGENVVFPDEVIKYLVTRGSGSGDDERGIRGLEEDVHNILSRVNMLKNVYGSSTFTTSSSTTITSPTEEKTEEKPISLSSVPLSTPSTTMPSSTMTSSSTTMTSSASSAKAKEVLNLSFKIKNIKFPLVLTNAMVDSFITRKKRIVHHLNIPMYKIFLL